MLPSSLVYFTRLKTPTSTRDYRRIEVNGPLSLVPVTPTEVEDQNLDIVILTGPTGSGKSSFIESLSPDQRLDISKDSLESVTQEVNCYRIVNLGFQSNHVDGSFVLMDTPGFLDPKLSEGRITKMITDSLDAFRTYASYIVVFILYFQPITDIRIGGSKRHAVKMLKEYVNLYQASDITVITTMWNTISTPKQLEDANCRFDALKNEIYASSDGLEIRVTRFDAIRKDSALSALDQAEYGWDYDEFNSDIVIDLPYQSLLCDNLLGRVITLLQQLHFIAEDKRSATSAGSENHDLLEIVIQQESVALSSLQSFVDDLVGIGATGLIGLQALLDTRYEENPRACTSPWPLHVAQDLPLAPPILLPADPAALLSIASDIHSKPTLVLPLPVAISPSFTEPQITPVPTSLVPQGQPLAPDASCFTPLIARFKRRFNRTRR
ncbi:hypothetical protein BJ165DRAFT_1403534 [Panaeolus papilionaceus]|nr:hypothetical protein BJ165DRAFT_1403534 [Panaeolus papilionaceus]